MFQAYIDDSYSSKTKVFVLAGHIASSESWADFSSEWEAMLPYGILDSNGRYHFHMTEMAMNLERRKRVPAFYRIIEKHALISISSSINLDDLKRAKERIWVHETAARPRKQRMGAVL